MNTAAQATNKLFYFARSFDRLVLFSFFSGLLLPFGFAPFHLPGSAILGITILFSLLQHRTIKQAFYIGFNFSLGFLGFAVSWVFVSIHQYGHLNHLVSAIITLCFLAFLSMYYILITVMYTILARRCTLLMSCLLFSAIWCLGEYIRATFMGGFPWVLLGFGQVDGPLKYCLPLFGLHGVGFLTCLCASFLAASFRTEKNRFLWVSAFVVVLLSPALLFKNISWTTVDKQASVSIGIIQANLSMRDKWDESLFWKLLQHYKEQANHLIHTNQLVVMPESAIPLPATYVKEYLDEIHQKARQIGSSVLLGIPKGSHEKNQYYNAMITLGLGQGAYLKQHLVPFGEFVPPLFQVFFDWFTIPGNNMKAGKSNQTLIRVHQYPIASLICYELAYPNLLRRQLPEAQWIVSISDDGWFGHSLAMYQHLQMAQALSLQMGRYQVVANNDGLSSVITDKGDVLASLPAFTEGTLESTVHPATGASPWVRWGDYPALFLCIMIVLFRIIALAATHKRRYPNKPT